MLDMAIPDFIQPSVRAISLWHTLCNQCVSDSQLTHYLDYASSCSHVLNQHTIELVLDLSIYL